MIEIDNPGAPRAIRVPGYRVVRSGKDEEHHKIIYAGLLRSKAVLEGLKINNLQIVNMSYEDFCRQVGGKTEVVFMTEEEAEEMREALRLYRKIKEAVVK